MNLGGDTLGRGGFWGQRAASALASHSPPAHSGLAGAAAPHTHTLPRCPQVDIVQMCVVELRERPGRPLFHLEHYIEGKYIKYNSNSGFVRDDNLRLTPQVRPREGSPAPRPSGARVPR